MNARQRRHLLIKHLVDRHRIGSQEELVQLLAEQDIPCTQATLSRDLRELNVARVHTPEGTYYRADPSARHVDMLREMVGMEILGIRHNGHMVVVRTLEGRAEGVAAFLDNMGHDNILGTLAGDDTVFVAPVDCTLTETLALDIRHLRADVGDKT